MPFEPNRAVRYSERLSAISHFTTEVALQLNNLLTPIICYAQLIAQLSDSGRFRDRLEKILTAARQAKAVMDGLLDFAGKQERHVEKLDLNRIVKETIPIACDLFSLEKGDVEFERDDNPVAFQGDPHQMVQALLHLLRNAAQATQPDQRPIVVRVSREDGNGEEGTRKVILDVEDRGCGISKKILPKVLLPFFTTREEEGAGLGLSTVFGIVEAHGGDLEIDTEEGKGTTVRISLPTQ
jgi:signal transduction histidine kinase